MAALVILGRFVRSWGNTATRRLFESGKSRFRGLDTESAPELLAILNVFECLDHISPLKSVALHLLKGNRRAYDILVYLAEGPGEVI